jgi:small-conductance mechanosensitive channel
MKFVEWTTSAVIFLSSILIGLIAGRIIRNRLKKVFQRAQLDGDLLLSSMRGITLLWAVLIGLYGAMAASPLSQTDVHFATKLLLIILILSITIALSKITTTLIQIHSRRQQGFLTSTSIFTNLTRFFIFVIGILTIFYSLGISLTPALTALGVGGLSLAFALQDTLSSLFSGLVIASSRQINPGDYVKIASGEEGYVTDITWRHTVLRTQTNLIVVVPNSKLVTNVFTNYNYPTKEVIVPVSAGVTYESDLNRVERVSLEVAREALKTIPGAMADFEPSFRFHAFSESSIDFTVALRAKEVADQALVRHEFMKMLMERFRTEGIEIAYPTRKLHIAKSDGSV